MGEKKQEKKAEAEKIDKRIKEFPEPETLTIEDADKVDELFNDYNDIGKDGQSFVSDEAKKKLEVLVNRVLELYKEKKEAEKKAKKDKAAAASIEDEISILPDVENLKLDDEKEVPSSRGRHAGLHRNPLDPSSNEMSMVIQSSPMWNPLLTPQ